MMESRWELYKITEMRDGCVYRTKHIGEVWLRTGASMEEQVAAAKQAGGDMLVAPSRFDFDRDNRRASSAATGERRTP